MAIPRNLSILAQGASASGVLSVTYGGTGVTTSTGTGSVVLSNSPSLTSPSVGSGNLTFSTTGQRITGDFSNATIANRVLFQSSTTNGATSIGVLPNGTSTTTNINLFNGTDPANASIAQIVNIGTEVSFRNAITGTGTLLPMTFYTGGSERMRVDTSGNVGIGTSSPANPAGKNLQIGTRTHISQLTVNDETYLSNNCYYNGSNWIADVTGRSSILAVTATAGLQFYNCASVSAGSAATAVEALRVDQDGLLLFNSGFGSAARAYGCRAWVNFNGQGTVAIRASGNVSSITDNGTGNYTINLSSAMPDTNYNWVGAVRSDVDNRFQFTVNTRLNATKTTSALMVWTGAFDFNYDLPEINVSIFR